MTTSVADRTTDPAMERLSRRDTYQDPGLECDIVMKGGITSGVLYPLAVCELAAEYQLRNVGGTSAGAIAAAAAAAAEYGRDSQRAKSGFGGLAGLPDWSSQPGNLVGVFQPAPSTRGLHGLLLAAIAKPTTLWGKLAKVLRVLYHLVLAGLSRDFWAPVLLVLPGLLLLWALDWAPQWDWLVGTGLVLALAVAVGGMVMMARRARMPVFLDCENGDTPPRGQPYLHCVPEDERKRLLEEWQDGRTKRILIRLIRSVLVIAGGVGVWLLVVAAESVRSAWAAGLAVLALGFGFLLGCVAAVVLGGGRGLSQNMLGIVSGSTGEGALSDWLTDLIDELAGHSGPHPLTFGDLRRGPAGRPSPDGDRFVNLEMLTTCVTQGRPYRLPDALGRRFFFDPEQFTQIFPERVMTYLTEYEYPEELMDEVNRDDDDRRAFEQAAECGLLPLPPADDLPVVVATRMSLSFPILISAVPLWAVDRSCRCPDGHMQLEMSWFSDGGITSNFPITFFDALLPRRPTFGMNLRKFHPAYPQQETQCENVWSPEKNDEGILEWWSRPTSTTGVGAVVGFLLGIVDTMQNWVDNLQLSVPGFRDRIVHISHNDDEGGMNLDMPLDTLGRLSERGRCAGARLVDFYTQDKGKNYVSWPNHRWVRMRSALALVEDASRSVAAAYAQDYDDDLHKRAKGDAPSYQWGSERQRALAIQMMDGGSPGSPGTGGLVGIGNLLGEEVEQEVANAKKKGKSAEEIAALRAQKMRTYSMDHKAPHPLTRLENRPGGREREDN